MVLDFHGTRRSLQEVSTLTSLLKTLGISSLSQVPKTDSTVVVGKNPAKVRCDGADWRAQLVPYWRGPQSTACIRAAPDRPREASKRINPSGRRAVRAPLMSSCVI